MEVFARHAPLCPAGHLPHKGGDQRSPLLSPISRIAKEVPEQAANLISPLVGEMAGRPEGGAKEHHPTSRNANPC